MVASPAATPGPLSVASASASPSYKSAVLADGPSVYFRLDESSGLTAADSSGKGHPGTYQAGIGLGSTGALIGDSDAAIHTNGASVVASDTGLPSGASPVTVEFWERGPQYNGVLFRYGSAFSVRSAPDPGGHDRLAFETATSGCCVAGAFTPYQISDGNWHQIAVTYDGSQMSFYVDGQVIGGGVVGALATTLGAGLQFGAGFAGDVDELSVYPSALGAGSIKAHYQASRSASTQAAAWAPPSLDFGAVVSQPQGGPTKNVSLQNTGTAILHVTTVSLIGPAATSFVKAGDSCSGEPVAPGSACVVAVSFNPTATGPLVAQLVATDTAGSQTASLSGQGIATKTPPSPYSLVANPVEAIVGRPVAASSGTPYLGTITVQAGASGTTTPTSAQVDWGDGSTPKAASIQPGPVGAGQSVFFVQAQHKYAAVSGNGGLTLTITAQIGTSTVKASAPVVVLPARPSAFFVVNPAPASQNQVSLLMPVAVASVQHQQITGYRWEFADGEATVYDNSANLPLYACVINGLIQSGGTDGVVQSQGCPPISSLYDGAIQLGILPRTTRNFPGGLTSTDILTIANLWKQYFPQHIIPHVWPYYSVSQTSYIGVALGIGVPGLKTPASCNGVPNNAVCYTVPSVTVEPSCAPVTAIFHWSSTCNLNDFKPRVPDYVAANYSKSAADVLGGQGAVSLVISKAILTSPSSDDIFLQVSVGGGVGAGGGTAVSATTGWINSPISAAPNDSETNNFVHNCTISGGGGLSLSVGPISLGGGYQGVDSPGGDNGFTTGFELFAAKGGLEASGLLGLSVNYAFSLSDLGVPLSAADLQAYGHLFNGVQGGTISANDLTTIGTALLNSIPGLPSAINLVTQALSAAQSLSTGCGKL
ncbi:MAG: hypothetical protein M3137_07660 [Actinomycetota bacterium]|nr:hypothetical protein [Actinomycetota bacterium]